MNIDEYTEKVYGVKLYEWQKELLKKLKDLPSNSKIIMGRYGRIYIVDGSKKEE